MFLFEKLEELGNTDCRVGKKTPMTSWFSGAYVHGGVAGLRNNTRQFVYATKYMAAFAKASNGGKEFSAVGVTRNSALGIHRDVHNNKSTSNMVLPLTSFQGGDLWVEDSNVVEAEKVMKEVPKRGEISGRIIQLHQGKVATFKPNLWHVVQPWTGDRVVMVMYTPRATKLKIEDIEHLKECGFYVNVGMMITSRYGECL